MQTLYIQPRYGSALGMPYPALQDDSISAKQQERTVAHFTRAGWDIARSFIVTDARSRSHADAAFEAEWCAEFARVQS